MVRHRCIPSCGRIRLHPVSPLPFFLPTPLHLLLESTFPNDITNNTDNTKFVILLIIKYMYGE